MTNLTGDDQPAVLGPVTPLATPGDTRVATLKVNPGADAYANVTWWNDPSQFASASVRYLSLFHGPIRSEGDLQIGDARIDLSWDSLETNSGDRYSTQFKVNRADTLDVLGKLSTLRRRLRAEPPRDALRVYHAHGVRVVGEYEGVRPGGGRAGEIRHRRPLPAHPGTIRRTCAACRRRNSTRLAWTATAR